MFLVLCFSVLCISSIAAEDEGLGHENQGRTRKNIDVKGYGHFIQFTHSNGKEDKKATGYAYFRQGFDPLPKSENPHYIKEDFSSWKSKLKEQFENLSKEEDTSYDENLSNLEEENAEDMLGSATENVDHPEEHTLSYSSFESIKHKNRMVQDVSDESNHEDEDTDVTTNPQDENATESEDKSGEANDDNFRVAPVSENPDDSTDTNVTKQQFEIIERPFPVKIIKEVPVRVEVPVDQPVPVIKEIRVPVKVKVDRPVPYFVHKPVPVYIERHVPVPVEKKVFVPLKEMVEVPKPYQVPVTVEKKVPFMVEKRVPMSLNSHQSSRNQRGKGKRTFPDYRRGRRQPFFNKHNLRTFERF